MGDPFASSAALDLPRAKEQISIRLDADVVAYFRALGPRYQTRINQVLKAFVATHPHPPTRRDRRGRPEAR